MAKRGFVRRAEDWSEVARWLGIFWWCRCRYSNVASYRCYYCGKRAPVQVRTLVAQTLHAAEQVEVPVHVAADVAAHVGHGEPAAARH